MLTTFLLGAPCGSLQYMYNDFNDVSLCDHAHHSNGLPLFLYELVISDVRSLLFHVAPDTFVEHNEKYLLVMAATTKAFRYHPLPEATEWMRILHLEPSTRKDAPLRGRLVNTRLDAHADYHAVSYLWGDSSAPLTDWCELRTVTTETSDTEANHDRLPILASCNAVLRHLRSANTTRALWIDFICIDQSNSAEKNQQVRIMQYIYRDASKVAMWLDLSHLAARDCKRVFRWAEGLSCAYRWGLVDIFSLEPGAGFFGRCFLGLLPWDIRYSIMKGLLLNKFSGTYVFLHLGFIKTEKKKRRRKGSLLTRLIHFSEEVFSILDNPYFGRTWTVQELVMAPLSHIEMHTSVGTVQWAYILALVELSLTKATSLSPDERMLRIYRRLSCRGSFFKNNAPLRKSLKDSPTRSENRLLDLWPAEGSVYPFHNIPSLLASEPRDKAYAFLWALQRCQPSDFDIFDVDYTKAVETVFTEFTIAVAHETGEFIMLFVTACQQDKMSTLPSWVPDWSKTPRVHDWIFLRSFGPMPLLKRSKHSHLRDQEGPTFQNTAMHIRGLRQADRVSRLERLPACGCTNRSGGGIALGLYTPHEVETLCVALNKVFEMLDDDDDLSCLSKLYQHVLIHLSSGSERLGLEALDMPWALRGAKTVRRVIRSYLRAKRSLDPSDVDVGEWSRGLTAEFKGHLKDETIESLLLELSSYKDYPHGAVNEWDEKAHIVEQLINSTVFARRDDMMEHYMTYFGSGRMGETIFKTTGGSVGFGQANIEVGDEVVQLKGVPRPTVVRKLDAGGDPDFQPGESRCILVSVAAVDGITGTEEGWMEEDLITYIIL